MFLPLAGALLADGPGVILSRRIGADFPLTADPNARPWKGVRGVFAENGGQVIGATGEMRVRVVSDRYAMRDSPRDHSVPAAPGAERHNPRRL